MVTPLILTALATALAGMSSSEMTKSMFFRALASQQQSKAGDQWAFFQAKKIRATTQESASDMILSLGQPEPFDAAAVEAVCKELEQALEKQSGDPKAAQALKD